MTTFDQCQANYDAQEHPDYYLYEDGGCDHDWKFLGEADGDRFYKCRKCNEECSS